MSIVCKFKKVIYYLLLGVLSLLLISCFQEELKQGTIPADRSDKETAPPGELTAKVSVDLDSDTIIVTSLSLAKFPFTGTCSLPGALVRLSFGKNAGGKSYCDKNGRWKIYIDFSRTVKPKVTLTLFHGDEFNFTQFIMDLYIEKDISPPILSNNVRFSNVVENTVSNETNPILIGLEMLMAENGTVWIYNDPICVRGVVGQSTIQNEQFTVSNIQYSNQGDDDGTLAFYAIIADYLGNKSECVDLNLSYTLDTLAPSPPVSLLLINPTTTPNTINNPIIQVSGLVDKDTLKVYSDSSCTQLVTTQTISSSTFQLTLPPLAAGNYNFYATSTDIHNNESTCSTDFVNYQYDELPPPDPLNFTGNALTPFDIALSWDSGGGTTRQYRIGYDIGITPPDCLTPGLTILDTNTVINNLESGADYNFLLCAVNGNNVPVDSTGVSVSIITPGLMGTAGLISNDVQDSQAIDYADFNHDGKLDIVVANATGGLDKIHLGDGSGGFTTTNNISVSSWNSYAIKVADLNLDGHPDVVIGTGVGQTSKYYFGDGAGNFGSEQSLSTQIDWVRDIAINDFNRDGQPDILLGQLAARDIIFYGDGSGGFTAPVDLSSDSLSTRGVATADLNFDGHPDVVVANYGGANKVYLADGSGGFLAGKDIPSNGPADIENTTSVSLEDINFDGYFDLLVTNDQSGIDEAKKIYLGLAGGQFDAALNLPSESFSSVFGLWKDFNGDGILDAFTLGKDALSQIFTFGPTDPISLYRTKPLGTITFPARDGTLADFNQDGRWDLAMATSFTENKIFLGNFPYSRPKCLFPPCSTWNYPQASEVNGFNEIVTIGDDSYSTSTVRFADFNHDGNVDIVQGIQNNSNLIYLGLGDGQFSVGPGIAPADTGQTQDIAVADFDRDGNLDIVVAYGNGQGDKIYLGDGAGQFATGINISSYTYTSNSIKAVDLNHDGKLDLLITHNGNTFMTGYLGDGLGGFSTAFAAVDTNPYVVVYSNDVSIEDYNNDGNDDFLVARYGKQNIIYLGDGLGGIIGGVGIQWSTLADDNGLTNCLAAGDFNKDGNMDFVEGVQIGSDRIYLGDGAGSFSPSTAISTDNYKTKHISVADMNGDGNLDLIMSFEGEKHKYYLGNGDGTFGTAIDINNESLNSLTNDVTDINHDGRLDLIFGYSDQKIKIFLGQ